MCVGHRFRITVILNHTNALCALRLTSMGSIIPHCLSFHRRIAPPGPKSWRMDLEATEVLLSEQPEPIAVGWYERHPRRAGKEAVVPASFAHRHAGHAGTNHATGLSTFRR